MGTLFYGVPLNSGSSSWSENEFSSYSNAHVLLFG